MKPTEQQNGQSGRIGNASSGDTAGSNQAANPKEAIIYKTGYSLQFGGAQYVAVVDGKIRRSHFSSSTAWAKSDDIVPTVREDFGLEPIWMADNVNTLVAAEYQAVNERYAKYIESHEHLPFNDYCDLEAKHEGTDLAATDREASDV